MGRRERIKNKGGSSIGLSVRSERTWLAIVLFVTFIAYSGSLFNSFCWDDKVNIIDNTELRSPSASSFLKLIVTPYIAMYTPVTQSTYFLNAALSGLKPAAFHLTDLLLHLGAVLLVHRFIKLLTGRAEAGLIGATVFALHPMNSEVVCWVSARSTVLSTILTLIMLSMYVRYVRTMRPGLMLLAGLFFLFACLAKPSALLAPFLLFAIDHFEKRSLSWRMLLDKIPFVIIALVIGVVLIQLRSDGEEIKALYDPYSPFQRGVMAVYAFMYYLVRFVLPIPITNAFGLPVLVAGRISTEFYLALAGLPMIAYLFLKKGPDRSLFRFSLLFYFFSLAPVLSIVPFGRDLVAARYAYLPYVGLCLLLGALLATPQRSRNSRIQWALALVLLTFTLLTHYRSRVWKDDITLFSDAVVKRPDNFFPHLVLGSYYNDAGDPRKSLPYIEESLRLYPYYADTYLERGRARSLSRDHRGSLADFNRCLELRPHYAMAYYDRGCVHYMMSNFDLAIVDLDSTITLRPDYTEAYFTRAMANLNLKNLPAACADWRTASELGSRPARERLREHCR